MDLTKEFNIEGKWFLPSKNEEFCYGELSYSFNGGLQLNLFGSLIGTKSVFDAKNNFIIDCIWGITDDGNRITILNAVVQEVGSSDLIKSEITVEYACISSTHFLTLETDKFDLVSINFNCSESFFSSLYSGISVKEWSEKGEMKTLQYQRANPKEIFKNNLLTTSLFFNYSSSFSHSRDTEFAFYQKVYLNSEFNDPLLFKKAISFGKDLRSLFSFFSRFKVFIKELLLREQESKEYFEVLFFQENKTNIKKLTVGDLIIQYKELNGEFEEVFKWWMNNSEYVTYGLSLYQQFVYSSGHTSVQKFLNIAFALETLHSTFFDKKNFSKEEYQVFKAQVKDFQMTEIFRPRFQECIGHFNELSFKKRIQELFEMNRSLIKEYIDNIDDFTSKVRDQRNYYAHKHSIEKANLIPSEHLDYYIFMCKLIFDTALLKIIGVSEKNIELMLKRDFIFRHYKTKKPKP
jgi:hypothetical protein